MNERRRPFRRGRGQRPSGPRANEPYGDADPYRETMEPPVPGTDNFDIPAPRSDANGASADDSQPFSGPADAGPPPPPETAETTSPPPYYNYEKVPTVYRGPYEYSAPDKRTDWLPQNQPS